MFFRSDNPNLDFDRWEAHQERQLARLPKCDCCGEPIQAEHYFEIHGEILCEECMNERYRKAVDFDGE